MNNANVIIVGGGFAGVAAAIAASKVGARATLLERTNMLGGSGLGAFGQQPIELLRSTCLGDLVAFGGERLETVEGRGQGCVTGHGLYFERMKQLGFYSSDPTVIHGRIADVGLNGIFSRSLS